MVMDNYVPNEQPESMNYVHYIWILLSILVSVTCSFCFLQPEWIIHPNVLNAFGIYAFCVGNTGSVKLSRTCGFYGGRFGFGNIPCTIWQAACLLYGGGSLFSCFGALCSLATMCVRTGWDKTLVLATRYLQISSASSKLRHREYMVDAEMERAYPVSEKAYLGELWRAKIRFRSNRINLSISAPTMCSIHSAFIIKVFLMTSGLLVYPLGFDSNYFRLYCSAGADVYNMGICHLGWTYVLAIVGAAISIFCPILSYFSADESLPSDAIDYKT